MDTLLFYTPGTCALACIVALEWSGEPFRLCRVDKATRAEPSFRRVNPRGQVPAARVDGRTLVEANAILTHIASRSGNAALLPAPGTWEADVANQWLAYLASGFHAAFWPYFFAERYASDEAMHENVRATAIENVKHELTRVDAHLAENEFILGTTKSALDPYLHAMDRWANKFVEMPKQYPHVFRHQKAMATDRGVRFGQAIERGENAESPGFLGHVELASLTA